MNYLRKLRYIIKREIIKNGFSKGVVEIFKIIFYQPLQFIYSSYLNIKSKFSSIIINKPFEIVYIPTNLINVVDFKNKLNKRYINFFGIKIRKAGLIINGTWDQESLGGGRSSYEIILSSFKQRFIENKEWQETQYYKFLEKRNQKNFQKYKNIVFNKYDSLYNDIKNNGYKSQKEIKGKIINEIQVAISRNGKVLFIDGRHRLVIAKILDIKDVPVIVNVWHKEYIDWIKNKTNIKIITPKDVITNIIKN